MSVGYMMGNFVDEDDEVQEMLEDFDREYYEREEEIRSAFAEFLSVVVCEDAESVVDDIDEVRRSVLGFLFKEHGICTYTPALDFDPDTGSCVRYGTRGEGF